MSNNTIKWTPLANGTTISNATALASAGFLNAATVYDNSLATALDQFGFLSLQLASLAVANPGYCVFYLTPSYDGTNYADVPAATNPAQDQVVAVVSTTTSTAAHILNTPPFRIPPTKFKFSVQNQLGVAWSNSTNTLTFYTADDMVL